MRASAFSRTGIESVGRFLAGLLLNLRGNQDLGQNVLTKKLGLVTELFSMAFALCCLLVFIYLSMATEPNKFVTMSPYCPANRT